jgi:hypothetical protein
VVLIVHQGLERGLQILKVDKWVGVWPNPASFVVNISKAIMLSPLNLFLLLAEHCWCGVRTCISQQGRQFLSSLFSH